MSNLPVTSNGKKILIIKRDLYSKTDLNHFNSLINKHKEYQSYYKLKSIAIIIYNNIFRISSLDKGDILSCVNSDHASLFVPESFSDWTRWSEKTIRMDRSFHGDYFIDLKYEDIGENIKDQVLINTILFNLS